MFWESFMVFHQILWVQPNAWNFSNQVGKEFFGKHQLFEIFNRTFCRTADQSELEVDGYSSTNSQQRISLGGISNPFREEKVRQCQKNIREGKMLKYILIHIICNPFFSRLVSASVSVFIELCSCVKIFLRYQTVLQKWHCKCDK